jgi:hypothetical protein
MFLTKRVAFNKKTVTSKYCVHVLPVRGHHFIEMNFLYFVSLGRLFPEFSEKSGNKF